MSTILNAEISLTFALKYQRGEFVENIAVSLCDIEAAGSKQKSGNDLRNNLIKNITFSKAISEWISSKLMQAQVKANTFTKLLFIHFTFDEVKLYQQYKLAQLL